MFGANAESATRYLNNDARRAGTESRDNRQSDKAFSSAQADFDAFSIRGHAQDGSQAVIHKKSKLDGLTHLVQNGTDGQGHEFQFAEQRRALIVRKSEQNFV